MFKHLFLAGLAIAAMPSTGLSQVELEVEELGARYVRQRRGKGHNNRRGKGEQSKPAKRSNRLHVSKRVRRKHRRAA